MRKDTIIILIRMQSMHWLMAQIQKKLFGEQTSVKIIPRQKRIIFHLRYSVTVV